MPATLTWPTLLTRLLEREDLSIADASWAMRQVMSGEVTEAQLAGFLIALRAKGETVDEIVGFRDAALTHAREVSIPPMVLDIVGTGGSPQRRKRALNVSTMACFVAAGAGAVVCKHGNRRASSTSGAFDLLDLLGIDIDVTPERVAEQVSAHRLGFAFARTFHPAMRFAGPVRAGIGIPTVFNVLGPLSHPGGVRRRRV